MNALQTARARIENATKHIKSEAARDELRAAYQAILDAERTLRNPPRVAGRPLPPHMLAAKTQAMNTGTVVQVGGAQ